MCRYAALVAVALWAGVVACAADQDQPVDYTNHTLFRVWPSEGSPVQIDAGFHDALVLGSPDVRHPYYEVVVPPRSRDDFLQEVRHLRWRHELVNANVQATIDRERTVNFLDTRAGAPYSWDRYQSYEETNAWMQEVAARFPDDVQLFDLGLSHQRRHTYGLRLARGGQKPAVFIEAGVHSREWIAPATATWIFQHLLTSADPAVRQLSLDYTWYVVPLVNPDGYAFTTRNRMWRKNRRPHVPCTGTDLNRNWDYHWREAGSSAFACSDAYAGTAPMSEPETRNLDRFVGGIRDEVKLYLSLHAYSQLLLWPEGHTKDRIREFDDYEQIGRATVEAIATRYGTQYERGSIIEAIYPASGSTIDYMRAKYQVPLAFCFELRPSRKEGNGGMGFILEPEFIVPTSEETFDGIAAMLREGSRLGYL